MQIIITSFISKMEKLIKQAVYKGKTFVKVIYI